MNGIVDKTLRLALDPVAPDGEWQAAAIAFVRKLRREGVRELAQLAPPPPPPKPSFTSYHRHEYGPKMPFGKYKGDPVTDVARAEPDYLIWVLDNCERIGHRLRSAILRALEAEGIHA